MRSSKLEDSGDDVSRVHIGYLNDCGASVDIGTKICPRFRHRPLS